MSNWYHYSMWSWPSVGEWCLGGPTTFGHWDSLCKLLRSETEKQTNKKTQLLHFNDHTQWLWIIHLSNYILYTPYTLYTVYIYIWNSKGLWMAWVTRCQDMMFVETKHHSILFCKGWSVESVMSITPNGTLNKLPTDPVAGYARIYLHTSLLKRPLGKQALLLLMNRVKNNCMTMHTSGLVYYPFKHSVATGNVCDKPLHHRDTLMEHEEG